MRKVLAVAVAAVCVGLMACQPTPATITATPSTTKPACEAITTVTGKVSPANAFRTVTLDYQLHAGGEWKAWQWFVDDSSPKGPIVARVASTGGYSLKYVAPNLSSQPTTRLRVRGTLPSGSASAVSASWYVTRPTGC